MAAEELTLSGHIQHHLTNAKMCSTDAGLALIKHVVIVVFGLGI